MAQVSIRINGYAYTVGCEDGQEPHLQAMGRAVDRYVERVKALGRHSGESQILVLASLLMADELHDMEARRAARADASGAVGLRGGAARPRRTGRAHCSPARA